MSQRPRGRPRSFDANVALKAASERFRTHGFAGTSLDDLAEATGLARPSLYAAFGDKRSLYLAALARLTDRVERSFVTLGGFALPLREMVERMLLGAIQGYMSGEKGPSGCLLIGTATAEAAADPEVRAALCAFLAMEDRCIEELLAAAGSTRPAASAAIVASVLHSLSIRARAGEPRESLDRIARDCAAMIV
ncbi:TetR/AcrR family transcriptional regulator [Sphingomonas sp. QA11]|uniref:TetR/AcrR family transcriptional regulator n=1 Tax=Sphingomonas sp. QA11 TaxID=2950605 RepID=UPI00234B8DD0|nr:TetR/AcrR family transcriptional regulator [Sphingomonas sp. QA11]WCM26434.1 TetR/AcrR family transcriptional regulator [Sphingomonas sp. QA11]